MEPSFFPGVSRPRVWPSFYGFAVSGRGLLWLLLLCFFLGCCGDCPKALFSRSGPLGRGQKCAENRGPRVGGGVRSRPKDDGLLRPWHMWDT